MAAGRQGARSVSPRQQCTPRGKPAAGQNSIPEPSPAVDMYLRRIRRDIPELPKAHCQAPELACSIHSSGSFWAAAGPATPSQACLYDYPHHHVHSLKSTPECNWGPAESFPSQPAQIPVSTAISQLQQMACDCNDAVLHLDELSAATQQLLNELGLTRTLATTPSATLHNSRSSQHNNMLPHYLIGEADRSHIGSERVAKGTASFGSHSLSVACSSSGWVQSSSSSGPVLKNNQSLSDAWSVPALPPFSSKSTEPPETCADEANTSVDHLMTARGASPTSAGSHIEAQDMSNHPSVWTDTGDTKGVKQRAEHCFHSSATLNDQPQASAERQAAERVSHDCSEGSSLARLQQRTPKLDRQRCSDSPCSDALSVLGKWVLPSLSEQKVTYPCGTTLSPEDLRRELTSFVAANLQHGERLRDLQPQRFLQAAMRVYACADKQGVGQLTWSRGQLVDFVRAVFQGAGLEAPDEAQIYQVYTHFDPSRQMFLSSQSCLFLVDILARVAASRASESLDVCMQQDRHIAHVAADMTSNDECIVAEPVAAAAPCVAVMPATVSTSPAGTAVSPTFASAGNASQSSGTEKNSLSCSAAEHHAALAERWVANHKPLPIDGTVSVAYSTGVLVEFSELAAVLRSLRAANAEHRSRILHVVASGELLKAALRVYKGFDDGSGYLSWRSCAIQDFVCAVFSYFALSPPNTSQVATLYDKFAGDRQMPPLNTSECLCLVDGLFRATFHCETEVPAEKQTASGWEKAHEKDELDALRNEQAELDALRKEQAAREALKRERAALEEQVVELRRAEFRARQQYVADGRTALVASLEASASGGSYPSKAHESSVATLRSDWPGSDGAPEVVRCDQSHRWSTGGDTLLEGRGLQESVQSAFRACDRHARGSLAWSEVKEFVTLLFGKLAVSCPGTNMPSEV
eukprot:TRINITY_DN20693_c0_g1_i1.p1 TRINITY_DN20693_c0_g1~~TRINITY_DN20693_c0_g1_i1.p1  ORF type:complete len:1008 (-),score=151.30 TRINITY_DN20693_c0_g1_i1:100-2868(-)